MSRYTVAQFAALACLTGGCGRSAVSLSPRSEMEVQVNGLALMDGGEVGFGGMFQQTCDFDTESGSIGKDYDAGPGLELVLDAAGDRGLAMLDGGLFELRQSSGDALSGRALGGEGVVHARLLGAAGHLTVREVQGGCLLERTDDAGAPTGVGLPTAACAPGAALAVNRGSGDALIGAVDGLWLVTGASMSQLEAQRADLLALDAEIDRLYVGARGGSALRARYIDGGLAWDIELDGDLVGVTALRAQSAVLVALEVDGGVRLLALDAEDGRVVGVADVEGAAATGLVADATGVVAGLVSPDRVRFFSVAEAD